MFSKKYLLRGMRPGLSLSKVQTQVRAKALHKYSRLAPFSSLQNQESFINGTQSVYIEHMYEQYRLDPNSVDASWRIYFSNVDKGVAVPYMAPPTLGQKQNDLSQLLNLLQGQQLQPAQSTSSHQSMQEGYKVMMLIRAFMTHGHLMADLDPLNLYKHYGHLEAFSHKFKVPEEKLKSLIDYRTYGFTEHDLDREFYIDVPQLSGILGRQKQWKLRDLIQAYHNAYCGRIGVEYMHIPDEEQQKWIRDKFENLQFLKYPDEKRLHNFDRLIRAHEFSNFLENKFNTMKRFGLEGCETFIPGLQTSMDTLVKFGTEKVVIGMPHRGRLNVLANIVRKPLEQIFSEFQGKQPSMEELDDFSNSGDVKYHLGTQFQKTFPDGKKLLITVLANPSHLETVDPVVLGRTRADQHYMQDTSRKKVVPVLIHGDAAFAGQGVVYETMQMTDLQNYDVGGTIHLIVNNQIGFTTTPHNSRSGIYCCELAKAVNAPILHVNAESADNVSKVFEIAAEYRQTFHNDVVIDLIGYRKFGHNELDQPMFTQPLMYKQIQKQQHVTKRYEEKLKSEGVLTEEKNQEIRQRIKSELERAYEASKSHSFKMEEWKSEEWDQLKISKKWGKMKDTGVNVDYLQEIGRKITCLPEDWVFHPQVKKIYEQRSKTIEEGKGIDWGTAEALAFATLIDEGFHVRLSGQDVERGTFSHRHAVLIHQETEKHYTPINTVMPSQQVPYFQVCNSHLSEYAAAGFEYGYSQANPNSLVLWEAQFGDFANGAQIITDTMLCCGESKWNVKSGLVFLLPHGYDGQGPEHSSCRVERYLQLCDEDDAVPEDNDPASARVKRVNWQVVNTTTAAQYFHILRRQLRRDFRKPLIVVAPKKLLRLKDACSTLHDFREGLRFQRVIGDKHPELVPAEKVRRLIFCTGQVYYDLKAYREKEGVNDVAVCRVEQLCPFPFGSIRPHLNRYKNAEVIWVQEEPKNQGAWYFIEPRIRNIMKQIERKGDIQYAGRAPSASTATGYHKLHEQELKMFLEKAMK